MKKISIRIVWISLIAVLLGSSVVHAAKKSTLPAAIHLVAGRGVRIETGSTVSYTFKSSNPVIAAVNAKTGVILGKRAGNCTVTVTAKNGKKQKVAVKVYPTLAKAVKGSKIQIIGHRGDTDAFPENSLQGIRSTKKRGWHGAEVDVFMNTDHDFLCFHDSTLERMCGVSDSIRDVTVNNRSQYVLKKKISTNETETIPTLYEALKTAKKNKSVLFIHLKKANWIDSQGVQRLKYMIRRTGMRKKTVIFGYNTKVLQTLASDGYTCGLFTDKGIKASKKAVKTCAKNGYRYLVTFNSTDIDASVVSLAHKQNIRVGMYKTRQYSQLENLISMGADFAFLYRALV